MDCDLARTLLLFQRPGELLAEDAAGLAAHLAACPLCATRVAAARSFDRAVTAAVGDVPVPAHGRARVLAHVDVLGAAQLRRAAARWASLAAAVVVAFGLAAGLAVPARPDVRDLNTVAEAASQAAGDPESATRAFLIAQSVPGELPADFDWSLHVTHGVTPVLGRGAPAVTFTTRPDANGRTETATVYALSAARFRFDAARAAGGASFRNATSIPDPNRRDILWIIESTSPTIEPFLRKPAGAA